MIAGEGKEQPVTESDPAPCRKRKFWRRADAENLLADMLRDTTIPKRNRRYLNVYFCQQCKRFEVGKCHTKQRDIA